MLQPTQKATTAKQPILSHCYSEKQLQAMQRTVLNIFERWQLADHKAAILLGGLSVKTLQRWRKGAYGKAGRDLGDRLSYILGIHKALRLVFSDAQRGYDWVNAANSVFDNRSALDVMTEGGMNDLARVRLYLDSVRGGW